MVFFFIIFIPRLALTIYIMSTDQRNKKKEIRIRTESTLVYNQCPNTTNVPYSHNQQFSQKFSLKLRSKV